MKALAFRISIPMSSPLSFSSAVMLGLSSILPPSGSSEIARCNISSFSKYVIFVLFKGVPPRSDSESNLLTCYGMNRYQRNRILLCFTRNHHQYSVMTSYNNPTARFGIKISFRGVSHYLLNFSKVKSTQPCFVLHIIRPYESHRITHPCYPVCFFPTFINSVRCLFCLCLTTRVEPQPPDGDADTTHSGTATPLRNGEAGRLLAPAQC